MTPERRAMVDHARSIIKQARWRHCGRTPWAVDCIGVLILAYRHAGGVIEDREGYSREPWRNSLSEEMRSRFGEPITLDEAQPGDIALFQWPGKDPSHLALLGDYVHGGLSMIHAHSLHGVTEHAIDGPWARLLAEVYRTWPT
jgi:cell wall-associated NlpC family hydrolase